LVPFTSLAFGFYSLWGSSGGLAAHQFRFKQHFTRCHFWLFNSLDEQPGCHCPDFAHRLPDGGQRWVGKFGNWDVVIAHHGHLAWYFYLGFAQPAQRANRHLVILGKQPRKPLPPS